MWKDDDERNEEQALTRSGKDVGAYRLSARLHHHVGHHHEAAGRKHNHLIAQRGNANGDYSGIVAKQRYGLLAEDDEHDGPKQEKHGAQTGGKPKSLLHPIVAFGAIAEATHRLETLSEADDDAKDKHAYARNDAHGSNGRIAIVAGHAIEDDGAKACKPLSGDGWRAPSDNFLHESTLKRYLAITVMNHPLLPAHEEQNGKAASLGHHGGQRRATNAHGEAEDEERVEQTVEDGSADHAIHRILGKPLKAHLVVDAERAHDEGRAQQAHTQILACVGKNGGRAAQEEADGLQEPQAHHHGYDGEGQRVEQARACHGLGVAHLLCAQLAGDIVARPIAEEERERLYEKHNAKHNAHRGRRLCVDLAHEEGVDQVIHAGQQHRDDGGNGHGTYHAMNGRMGKKLVFIVGFHPSNFSPCLRRSKLRPSPSGLTKPLNVIACH